MKSFKNKNLIVFDLDGTLAPSKSIADKEMIGLLLRLLEAKGVAVIGGGKYSLFKEQLIDRFPRRDDRLENLFLFPTTANSFYRYRKGKWTKVYTHDLSSAEKKRIKHAFAETFKELNYKHPAKVYGPVVEDRQTQMTFSPLGQDVVSVLGQKGIRLKEEWKKKNNPLRFKMAKLLGKKLKNLEVHVGGLTSVDVTRKGIDKAYGLRQINKYVHVPVSKMFFIGDALYPGGNDYAVKKTGVDCQRIDTPDDTKKIIKNILKDS
jgi:phosphomannomutase